MSEPIKVGDLVTVVKPTPCCGNQKALGRIFSVPRLTTEVIQCVYCGATFKSQLKAVISETDSQWSGQLVSRLKRIPPLEELEGEKNKEELTA